MKREDKQLNQKVGDSDEYRVKICLIIRSFLFQNRYGTSYQIIIDITRIFRSVYVDIFHGQCKGWQDLCSFRIHHWTHLKKLRLSLIMNKWWFAKNGSTLQGTVRLCTAQCLPMTRMARIHHGSETKNKKKQSGDAVHVVV